MAGGSASVTMTLNEHWVFRPAASVTSNVLTVMPTGKVAPEAKPAIWAVVAPGQLSVPTGATYVTTAPHTPKSLFTGMLAGQTMAGGSASVTMTLNEHWVFRPAASVTSNVLTV